MNDYLKEIRLLEQLVSEKDKHIQQLDESNRELEMKIVSLERETNSSRCVDSSSSVPLFERNNSRVHMSFPSIEVDLEVGIFFYCEPFNNFGCSRLKKKKMK